MPKSCPVLRDLLPSLDGFMLTKGVGLLLEFNMTTYNLLFAGRSWEGTKLNEVASVVGTGGCGIPPGTKIVADHESDLW